MAKPQFAIMRFAKYKGPEISRIEAHDERTKEKYASNPDVDTSRSHLNFHLIEPPGALPAGGRKTDQGSRLPHPFRQRAAGRNTDYRQPGILQEKIREANPGIL